MSANADLTSLERLLTAWSEVEPPQELDRRVLAEARRMVAEWRADPAAQLVAPYPLWLLALTAALVVAVVALGELLPAARVAWHLAWRPAYLPPLATPWLVLAASNLLALIAAPIVGLWRRSGADC